MHAEQHIAILGRTTRFVESNVHRYKVVGILLAQLVGIAVADLNPFAESRLGNGLLRELYARSIKLQSNNLGIWKTVGIVYDVIATTSTYVEYLATLLQSCERLRSLGQGMLS
jgi:hypothetical protein